MTTLAMARKKLVPKEHTEQVWLFQWAELAKGRYPDLEWLYAIPNWIGVGTERHGAYLKAEGRKADYPDIGLDVARGLYHGLRIELKRVEGGQVRPGQKRWHEHLQGQGYRIEVCKGWEVARDKLIWYLSLASSHPSSHD